MAEEVGTLVWREARDKIAECVPECLNGSQCPGAQESFEFGKGLLNWVQVGTVGWQVKQSCAGGFDRFADPGDLVGTEIVHDDDVATCQRGNQYLLDIGQERLDSPLIAPLNTQGATRRSWRRPAMKVEVFQCPWGTASTSRWPTGAQP